MAARMQMSHTVTVTRTTTSTTTSAIILNTGYCKTAPGLLKIAEVIIGLIIFILMNIYSEYFYIYYHGFTEHMYLFLVVFACLLSSTCLLLSCLFSLSTSSIISKTLYEFIYHGIAFLLYLVTMILYFVKDRNNRNSHHPNSTVGLLGLALFVLITVYTDEFRLFYHSSTTSHLYLYLVSFACFVGSFCLLAACLFSLGTSSIIAKTLFEFIFHGVAFLLYLLTLILYFVQGRRNDEHPYLTAAILAAILTVLYLASTILAFRSYRGV